MTLKLRLMDFQIENLDEAFPYRFHKDKETIATLYQLQKMADGSNCRLESSVLRHFKAQVFSDAGHEQKL